MHYSKRTFSHIQSSPSKGEADCFVLFYVHQLDDWGQKSSSRSDFKHRGPVVQKPVSLTLGKLKIQISQ